MNFYRQVVKFHYMLYTRHIKTDVLESAQYSPVVLINGARQTGKSTLAKQLFSPDEHQYITLDDISVLGRAKSSPKTFIQGLPARAIIDEVQRAPELFLAIKEAVDQKREPGKYILTGSANVLTLPKLAESLAGRMDIHTLWPLSQGELANNQETFIDTAFSTRTSLPVAQPIELQQLLALIVQGGYPDALQRGTRRARDTWWRSYLSSILGRDVRELSNIDGITELPDLLSLLASRTGSLANLADLSRSLTIPYMTLKRYLHLLEAVFLVVPLPSWSRNLGKRLVKAPKLYVNDTGLLCHLLGRDVESLQENRTLLGAVFENFVVMEIMKQASWSQARPRLYHFRTLDNRYEVDIVMEAADGSIVGIECKASSTVTDDHFKGLKALQEASGPNFKRGVAFYTGTSALKFDERLEALPISSLWQI